MLKYGSARKVTIHLNEDSSSDSNFTYEQVFQFLYDQGVAGASLIRPEQGFGAHHHRHDRDGQGAKGRHLPVQIEFIETPENVDRILFKLCELVRDGLIEMHDTTVIQAVRREEAY